MLFTWWLRPDFSAARVGEQSAVVWKLLNRRPACPSRSIVGIEIDLFAGGLLKATDQFGDNTETSGE